MKRIIVLFLDKKSFLDNKTYESIRTYYIFINHITKVRSRQAVKLPAVQPVVMWTPALGSFWRKNEKNLFFYMFEFSFSFFICPWYHINRSFQNKRTVFVYDNGQDRFTNRKNLLIRN